MSDNELRRAVWTEVRDVVGPLIGLAAVIGLFALIGTEYYLGADNLRLIAKHTIIVGLGAIGMTFVIVSGGIDLSVGSVIALAAVVTALAFNAGAPPLLALFAGVGAGGACGLVNGLLITRLSITPFIATLGMLGVARGFAKYLGDNATVNSAESWLTELTTSNPEPSWLLVGPGIWLMFLLGGVMGFVLRRTPFGVHAYAVGSSEATAQLCGVPVARVKLLVYVICGLFAGLAGVMSFSDLNAGDPTTAKGEELNVIAAVVIGGASLSGGTGRVAASLIGAFLMTFLINGCEDLELRNYTQDMIIGAIIVAAVALDQIRHGRTRAA
ncbi:MAG: ABC transporter permease [Planctomycetota bacterium]